MPDDELVNILDTGVFSSMTNRVRFYAPSFMRYKTSRYSSTSADFPTISVTGKKCALKCKHCGGKVLNTMHPIATSEELFELCAELKRKGAVGCLLSGGCLPNGSVPLNGFVDVIGRIKRELGLTILVHTGIVDLRAAQTLRKSGVDAALIDIIGSDETIKEIYKLNMTIKNYNDSLGALHESGIAFIPHVIVGLHHGGLKGELKALEMISQYSPSALVIIAFMPIRGTAMEKTEPPRPVDIVRVTAVARLMFPNTPLVLGCMRPRGRHQRETDLLAIKAGVDAIAFPAEEAINFAEERGREVTFSPFCCSQVYSDIEHDFL
ncbi:radical SAM protein [Candidatus Bathyarchaeota archaeon]|nr:radical SAM protein [Candidatus Bathyarchaeota archaeon]